MTDLKNIGPCPWYGANSQKVADTAPTLVAMLETLEQRYEAFVTKESEQDSAAALFSDSDSLLRLSDWIKLAACSAISSDAPYRCVGCGGTRPCQTKDHPAPTCAHCAALLTEPYEPDNEDMFAAETAAMLAAEDAFNEPTAQFIETSELSMLYDDDDECSPLAWVSDLANEALRQVREARRHAEVFCAISRETAEMTKQANITGRADGWTPLPAPTNAAELTAKLEIARRASSARRAVQSGAGSLRGLVWNIRALTYELVRWDRITVSC